MRPEPILFTIPNFITAGSGQVMMNIVEGLDKERFAPAVCVAKKGGRLDREVEHLGIPFIEAPFTVPAQPYRTLALRAWQAAQTFRSYRFALWHSWHYLDDYTEALIARLAGTQRWVYTKKAMGWGSRAWLVRSYLASRIVVDNTDMPQVMFDRIGLRHKTRYIPHSVRTDVFAPDVEPRLQVRAQRQIPTDSIMVGCVAHLVPVKGHPTLIEAIARIPDVYVVLAGKPLDNTYTTALHQQVQQLGIEERVHFLGNVTDVPALLAEMNIVVLPTWARWRMEGCPVALLEAMACGKACIATDIPGARDIIEPERNGLLVPPEDTGSLANALRRLVSSPTLRHQLGQAARQRVVTQYSVEREVADHEALYAELLGL